MGFEEQPTEQNRNADLSLEVAALRAREGEPDAPKPAPGANPGANPGADPGVHP